MRREVAAVLVTGDRRLFGHELTERVMTPRQFADLLEG